jgi:glutathione S-transferase
MTDAIAFYHNPQSRGRIVHWMLEEVNAPYEIKVVNESLSSLVSS